MFTIISKFLPEWRNFAKYGHTIGRRKRIHCAIKASLFNNNLTPACQRVRYVNIAIDIGRCKAVTTSSTFQLPSTVSFRKLHLVPENFESFNYVVLESLKVLFNSRLFSKTLKFYLVPEILNVLFSSWKLYLVPESIERLRLEIVPLECQSSSVRRQGKRNIEKTFVSVSFCRRIVSQNKTIETVSLKIIWANNLKESNLKKFQCPAKNWKCPFQPSLRLKKWTIPSFKSAKMNLKIWSRKTRASSSSSRPISRAGNRERETKQTHQKRGKYFRFRASLFREIASVSEDVCSSRDDRRFRFKQTPFPGIE